MCGIAGEVTFHPARISDEWARLTCKLMAHRGPDGHQVFVDSGVALAHRRLSIIDVAGGTQPMSYAGGRYWITFNGEIYNFQALRSELKKAGCSFETRSDTEVILAAYAAWGVDAIRRLNGIFAFAIWDKVANQLILARDHLGIKPLLYHHDDDGLRFASEMKALLAHSAVRREIDHEALCDYLTLGYVLAPKTIVRGIRKLPPAHYLVAGADGVSIHNYWDLAGFVERSGSQRQSDKQYFEQFEELLQRTVSEQMISDVPLGAFLSGGLDSSTVSYYAAARTSDRLKTFSIGFEEAGFSELDYAQQVATQLDTDHRQQVVSPVSLDELSRLVWFYDEPLGDTSIIPTFFLSRLAREQVTVSLSGDGGDELLAGYDTYLADRLQAVYARMPGWIHRHVVAPAAGLIPSTYDKVSLDFKIKQFVAHAHASPEESHFGWRMMFDDQSAHDLMNRGQSNGYLPINGYLAHYQEVPHASPLNRSQYVDIKTWLVDDILLKVDRASMACGLEVRVPFLSPRLVEFAMSLPDHLKLNGLTRKFILKQVMKKALPPTIINRKKSGFNAPISAWMRGPLRRDLEDLFAGRASSLVDLGHPGFKQIWAQHVSGQSDHGFKLWALLSLVLWEQKVYSTAQS